MKKRAIDPAEDTLPPDILEFVRQRETNIIETIAGQLEDFRLQVLAQGHKAAAIATMNGAEGQVHTYFCPKCKGGARLTVLFDAGEMKFTFDRSGSALRLTCHEACKQQAVASFKATALAMFEVEARGYNIAMRRTGRKPDVGRLITMGKHDFTQAQYTTPATSAGQNEENDER